MARGEEVYLEVLRGQPGGIGRDSESWLRRFNLGMRMAVCE